MGGHDPVRRLCWPCLLIKKKLISICFVLKGYFVVEQGNEKICGNRVNDKIMVLFFQSSFNRISIVSFFYNLNIIKFK